MHQAITFAIASEFLGVTIPGHFLAVLGPKYRKVTVLTRNFFVRVHQRDLWPENASGFIFGALNFFFFSQEFWARRSPELVTHKNFVADVHSQRLIPVRTKLLPCHSQNHSQSLAS